MSTTVDERIVSMQFDNRQFESNVSTSMSTLDKLKQKLNFSGSAKAVGELNNSIKKVDFSQMEIAATRAGFHFQDVWLKTATVFEYQVARRIVNAAENMMTALTIDPIKTGLQEYETQINAVQTILANTQSKGSTLKDVNAALDELNEYADLTIYNFTEMTRNIGTFTAAGVELDTAVNAIKGIANLAAVSGSTSQQASTAMYQLSQALASGTVKLMDWNSVVNAGMGGQVFQDALKETARVHGIAIDSMIEEQGSFRETLSKGWLTSEILTETLQKFTLTTEGLTDAEIEANREMLRAKGYTEDQIEEIFKLGNTATDAATKVKTLTQMWDVLKEAAQSGWSQTWRTVIGDFEEAKALFTPLTDFFTGVIQKTSDWRNSILTFALAFSEPWKQIKEKLSGVEELVTNVTSAVTNVTDSLSYFQDIVNKVWRGDYNNWGDNPDRRDLLTAAGYDYRVVQDLVNKGYQYKLTMEDVNEVCKEYGYTIESNSETTKEAESAISDLTDAQLEELGLTEEEISMYRALQEEADRLGISVTALAERMSKNEGRTLLIDSLKNIGLAIVDVVNIAKTAWGEIFDVPSIGELAIKLYFLIDSFHKFTAKLRLTGENGEFVNGTGEKLTRTFKGLFAVLDIVSTITGGALKIAFKVLKTILGAFDVNVLDVTASIGDAIVAFRDWLFENNALAKSINGLVDKLPGLISDFKDWFRAFKETPAVQKLVKAIEAIRSAFSDLTSGEISLNEFAASLGENLARALTSLPGIALQVGKDFIAGFANGIDFSVSGIIDKVVSFCLNFVEAFKEALGVQSPSWKAFDTAVDFFQGLINGIKYMIGKVVGVLKKVGEKFVDVFKSLWGFITDESGSIEWGKIFAGGVIVAMLWIMKKLANAFSGIASAFGNIDDLLAGAGKALRSFGKVLDGISWDLKAKAMQKMAIAIAILVASIWVLTTIDDVGKLWNAVGVIAVLALILVGLSVAVGQLSSASMKINKEGASIDGLKQNLLQIGLAMLALAYTVKLIGDLDPEKAKQGFIGLAAIATGLVIFLAALGGISRYSREADRLGKMMLKMSVAMSIMVIVMKMIAKMDPYDIVIGLAVMEVFVLFCVELGIANRIAGQNGDKFGSNMLKISVAMGIMTMVMKMIAIMDEDDIYTGIAVLQAFVILIGEMAVINRLAGKNQTKFGGTVTSIATSLMIMTGVIWILSKMNENDIEKGIKIMQKFVILIAEIALISRLAGNEGKYMAKNILAMSAAIAILAGVAILLSFVELSDLAKGITAVGLLSLMMTLMIRSLKGAQNAKGAIMMMAVAIGIMAGSIVALSFIDTKDLASSAGAMVAVMSAFALMIHGMKGLKNIKVGPLIALTGVVLILGGIVALLSLLDPESALPNAAALSLLLLAMSSAMLIMSKTKGDYDISFTQLQSMALVVAELAVVLGLMSLLPNPANMIPSAIAIGILLNTLATSILIMSKANGNFGVSFTQLQSMALVMVEVAAVLSIMSFLPNPTNMIPSAIAIGILLNALATSILIMSKAKGDFSVSFTQLQSMALVVAEIAVILGLLSVLDIEPSIETAVSLSVLLLAMSAACLIVSMIPAGAGTTGALELAGFIGIMAAVITAAGLLSKIPGFNELLADGGNTLGLVGKAIGNFVGGIVAGIAGGFISIIPQLGIALSEFATSVQPFIELVSDLDSSVVLGAGYLTAAILALSAASFISGIMNILSLGESSLTKLGEDLCEFGTYAKTFFDTIKDVDAKAIDAATNVANMLLALTGSELIATITEKFGGSVDFSTMGQNLVTFGEAVVSFSETISGKIDIAAVEAATNAGLLLVELNKSLPRSGGWIQDIIGEQDFGKFAEACTAFANCILSINEVVSQEGFEIQSEKIEQLVVAGEQFNRLNTALPRTGGIAQDLAGEQDLAGFGAACVAFATCMIMISQAVSSDDFVIQSEKIGQLVTAGTQFNELNTALPKTGGIAQDLAGEEDLAGFGAACAAFAACMIVVNEAISQEGFSVNLDGMEQLKQAGLKMNELQDALPKSGGWWQEIAGEQDIGDFGSKIKTFAQAIVDFSTSATNLDQEAISNCLDTVNRIKNIMSSLVGIDYSGVEEFTGVGTGGFGADGPAYDIAKAISKFGDEVANINTGAVTVAVNAASSLKTMIGGLANLDTSGVENFKPVKIGEAIVSYSDKVSSLDSNAVSSSITCANNLISLINSTAGIDTSGVNMFKGAVESLANTNFDGFAATFNDAAAQFANVGTSIITNLTNGIKSKQGSLRSTAVTMVTSIANAFKSKQSSFAPIGAALITRLASGMVSKRSYVASVASSIANSAASSSKSAFMSFYYAGGYLVDGFAAGISASTWKATAKAAAMATAAYKAAKEALDINSPSKVFRRLGTSVPEGFAQGIEMLGGVVKSSAVSMADTAISGTKKAISRITDVINTDIDTQPSIRPVLDLSDVKSGVGTIGDMLSMTPSVGVLANVGAISYGMNSRQNVASNDDVVSAISALGRKLSNISGDTYTINGVSYDEGTSVSDAIKTITRAAIRERRV